MADAAVEFLLENLKQLLLYHAKLLSGVREQVENLEKDLRMFNSFLKDFAKERREHDRLRELARQIRDVTYAAEDAIDEFVVQGEENKSKNYLYRAFYSPKELLTVAREVENVSRRVREIYKAGMFDFATLDLKDRRREKSMVLPAPVTQKHVVGFEDEVRKLIGYLMEETEQLDVVSVIGMPGLGKTTLAGKIFHDPAIQDQFPTCIWVYISQEFTKKNVFLSILREFTKLSDDMYRKSEQELAELVIDYLESGKFLIVMDDVWTIEDWDKLKVALPMENKSGKVLITSRHEYVAQHANRNRLPHRLDFLKPDQSWLLLRWEVFGEPKCPPDLEGIGKVISAQCGGLPLAIVVIGGILAETISPSGENTAIRNAWNRVSQSVREYINQDPEGHMEKIIYLSYDKLPYHLRACFLYFGMFPEDFEIPVWKLIRMWIAEGFIQQKPGFSLEETAEKYLDDLIKRNMIRIDKTRPDGTVKTCRIHDTLHDFCKTEAGNERENFLQEMKISSNGAFEPPVPNVQMYRRLCIHSNVLNFLSSKPYGPHIRSFACFSTEEINLTSENISSIPAAFKLLRVLDVEPIKFTKIPSDLYHLAHLKYIALSFHLGVLPSAFSKLVNIQTLIVDTTCRNLEIEADISKMTQLRHLKTNVSATLLKAGKSSKKLETLQTLGMISPHSCTADVLDRVHNLKKLGIRGHLTLLLEGKSGSFDCLGKLEKLEKLKLLNDAFPHPASECKLCSLPPPYKFPPNLRILTFSNTFLDWTHMYVLGLLPNLEVLKLKERAFMGKYWEAQGGGFGRLEVLYIGRTNLSSWSALHHHFPRLKRLVLKDCEELQDIPIGLADIPTLQLVDLQRTRLAAASARRIEAIKKQREIEAIKKKQQEEIEAIKKQPEIEAMQAIKKQLEIEAIKKQQEIEAIMKQQEVPNAAASAGSTEAIKKQQEIEAIKKKQQEIEAIMKQQEDPNAAASARRTEAIKKQQEYPNTKVSKFKLSIFPLDE